MRDENAVRKDPDGDQQREKKSGQNDFEGSEQPVASSKQQVLPHQQNKFSPETFSSYIVVRYCNKDHY